MAYLSRFFENAVRYVSKAKTQGSPAVLQTWPFVMHVWQAFQVPETDEALEAIVDFLAIHTASTWNDANGR